MAGADTAGRSFRNRKRTAAETTYEGAPTGAPDRAQTGRELARFQDMFQRALMQGDLAILEHLLDSSKEDRRRLFEVYANAYVGRLVDVVKTNYEKTAAYLGDAEMLRLGRDYVRLHPSRNANARRFGDQWPAFVAANIQGVGGAMDGELAQLEQALNDVFDAPDAGPLQMEDLLALAPADWPGVMFSPLVSTRRLTLTSNAADIWRALNAAKAPPPASRRPEPERLVIFRHEGNPHFREFGYEEAMMWDQMARGLTFASLCEMVAMQGGEDGAAVRAAGYVQGWIAAGLLAGPEAG